MLVGAHNRRLRVGHCKKLVIPYLFLSEPREFDTPPIISESWYPPVGARNWLVVEGMCLSPPFYALLSTSAGVSKA